jgi:hypothetical protein
MPAQPTSPTVRKIGILLTKAGFERSKPAPSQIRGFGEWSEGFKLANYSPGQVEVEHRVSSLRARNTTTAQYQEHLSKYRKVIEDAGYVVREGSSLVRETLVVGADPVL